jgi:hypothetical protein
VVDRKQQGTPRAPISAHLPLLPSGPGGFGEMTPRGESMHRLRAGQCADAKRSWVISPTEDSPSGLWRSLGKRVGSNPSGVQIPYPPPAQALALVRGLRQFSTVPDSLRGDTCNLCCGGVSERPKERASKARVGATSPWVQIPPPPPYFFSRIHNAGPYRESLPRTKKWDSQRNLDLVPVAGSPRGTGSAMVLPIGPLPQRHWSIRGTDVPRKHQLFFPFGNRSPG